MKVMAPIQVVLMDFQAAFCTPKGFMTMVVTAIGGRPQSSDLVLGYASFKALMLDVTSTNGTSVSPHAA